MSEHASTRSSVRPFVPNVVCTNEPQMRRQEEAARFLAKSKEDYEAESKKQIERALATERRRMQSKLAQVDH